MNVIPLAGNPKREVVVKEKQETLVVKDGRFNNIEVGNSVTSTRIFSKADYIFHSNSTKNNYIAKKLFESKLFKIVRIISIYESEVKTENGLPSKERVNCLILKYEGSDNLDLIRGSKAQSALNLQDGEIAVLASDVVFVK